MADDETPVTTATRLLRDAPPGEFDDCVKAVRGFLDDPEIANEASINAYPQWAKKHCIPITIDDHQVIICQEAERENGKYLDPVTMKEFKYDFTERKVVTEQGEEGEDVEPESVESTTIRTALQEVVNKFATVTLQNGIGGVYDIDGGCAIIVSGSSISKENYRTGSVVMKFTLKEGTLAGTICFDGHFFENGNATCVNDSEFSASISQSDEAEIAAAVVKKLLQFYEEWSDHIHEGFDLLASEGLNKLRRRLPITQTKINWAIEIHHSTAMANTN